MKPNELQLNYLQTSVLPPYNDRAKTDSARFLLWFMEEIFRLDSQDADDACVDSQLDKGIDGIFVSEQNETVYFFQSKLRKKLNVTLGDKDLKEFSGSLDQFESVEKIEKLLEGNASIALKNCIKRTGLIRCVKEKYSIVGVFCTNVSASKDALKYLEMTENIELYDSNLIAKQKIDVDAKSGIQESFSFDVSDTEIIQHESKYGVSARIFLANAQELVNLGGILDGTLFEQNVRFSLGDTKINKGLISSIKDTSEHNNFPLYHNGITLLCEEIETENDDFIKVRNYVVVNGAQSITSLHSAKAAITGDLRILTKIVAVKGNTTLTEKITYNSNNQNPIKARDMRSNHPIQERLKREIEMIDFRNYRYEVKRGENNQGFDVISNEDAGLMLLAVDLGEPWSCHQRYRIMDDSHSKIFGEPDVTGHKVLLLHEFFSASQAGIEEITNKAFAKYNLTKYFLGYAVADILKTSEEGQRILKNPKSLFEAGVVDKFIDVVSELFSTVGIDLDAEIEDQFKDQSFDYKASLKNAGWCRNLSKDLQGSYLKDVRRKRADPISDLLSFASS